MRALVLSAGGQKGAFQCGVLQHLLYDKEIHYPIICGVSVGAINGAYISQYGLGEEKLAAKNILNLWNNLTTKNIYKPWGLIGRLGAIWRLGFYDGKPLTDLIYKNISQDKILESGKHITVGAVSLNSGRFTLFNQDHPNFIDAIIASASFPGIIPPRKIGAHYYTDGGIKEYSPIKLAIDQGASHLDIIISSPEIRVNKFIKKPTTIDVITRSFDLSVDKIMVNDLEKMIMYNKLSKANLTDKKFVSFNIIRPVNNLTEDSMVFATDEIKKMIKIGYERCVEVFQE